MNEPIVFGGLVGFELEWIAFETDLKLYQVVSAGNRVVLRLALAARLLGRRVF